ncbi:nucleoside-diphosphate kinase [Microbaculum marinum]|uniref:Nucleoside-diphosphate kinase n=1 Tax=Microbaculum marinum TaxID=1764581 RepID=A0AAW9RSE3_9HYPH
MSNDTCMLSTKDYTILTVMRDRCREREAPLARILRRKVQSAVVLLQEDLPPNVSTLNSRVTFSVDGGKREMRILSRDRMASPIGMILPITTLRGLALLGLVEGQEFVVTKSDGSEERVTLHHVCYQPETARRKRKAIERVAALSQPTLSLVDSVCRDRRPGPTVPDGYDDPGPSAA